ncbi:MAG TPA: isoprenylcysteine carboxylmethyltransferase family protein [Candidatus Binataceae bacterium]|nr:isoprenylcysteine carboxylmethyltransferase family protein [Candidatus Binataceae bacterium]
MQDNPGVIARPPRIFLGFLVIGLVLDRVWPAVGAAQLFGGGLRLVPALILVAIGVTTMTLAIRQFGAAGTNVPTPLPAKAVVTTGLYSYSRNPIYCSMILIYSGLAIGAASVWSFVLLVPVLLLIRYGVIAREERYLDGKFGAPYIEYRARVRRWI